MSQTLDVSLGPRSYSIRIGPALLKDPGSYSVCRGRRALVVTDETVALHHLAPVLDGLGLSSEDALALPAGEAGKNWASVERIIDWLLSRRVSRDAVLIALGGGVTGDMTGFAAAIYQRGIDFIQLPTTLLAQVDSSVGGKTGINHPRGKNMIGAFHQPRAVIADTDTLKTLPLRELRAGIAEVIKYGMLADAAFFGWQERNMGRLLALDASALAEAIRRSCEIKARIVGEDEREQVSGGARALLNLGHTFGHAIETHTGYSQWLHGEAVAVGLCMAADLSARMGWLSRDDAARCQALVAQAGLPVRPPLGMRPEHFRSLMSLDKKVSAGQLRLILMRGLGRAVMTAQFEDAALNETLTGFTAAEE